MCSIDVTVGFTVICIVAVFFSSLALKMSQLMLNGGKNGAKSIRTNESIASKVNNEKSKKKMFSDLLLCHSRNT